MTTDQLNQDYTVITEPPAVCVDDSNTTGTENGTDRYPFNTIQEGVDAVATGGTVKVAQGTYTGTGTEVVSVQSKTVYLRGGYVGGSDYAAAAGDFGEANRNWGVNATTIDGEDARRCATFDGAGGELSGFRVVRGKTTANGGGVCCSASSATIVNNTVAECSAENGGGVFCEGASPVIAHNTITGTATLGGGGIYCLGCSSETEITDNDITGCAAWYGGGMWIQLSSARVTANRITGNTGQADGGGILSSESALEIRQNTITGNTVSDPGGRGGGILSYDSPSPIVIADNTIAGNSAENGGAIYCLRSEGTISGNTVTGTATLGGGGIVCMSCSPEITTNQITGCTAHYGGGIYCADASPAITDNTISANTAAADAGGILCTTSSPEIRRNRITDNTVSEPGGRGGGILIGDCSASLAIADNTIAGNSAESGGGIAWRGCSSTVSNNTVTGNNATYGGGICSYYDGAPSLVNCIVWGNTAANGGQIAATYTPDHPASVTVSYSDVEGGQACAYVEPGSTLIWGAGNIDANPFFVGANDGRGPDDVAGTDDDDYHLGDGSPCTDVGYWGTGVPEDDRDGNPRYDDLGMPNGPDAGTPPKDIGAYERQTDSPPTDVTGTRSHREEYLRSDFYQPGWDFCVTIRIEHTGGLTSLGVSENVPAGWTFVSASGPNPPNTQPTVGQGGTLEFSWTVPPASPVEFTYQLAVPDCDGTQSFIGGQVLYRRGGGELQAPIPDTSAERRAHHAGDYWPPDNNPGPGNRVHDWGMDFHELLRIIQFYNVGQHYCDDTSEDGYSPLPGSRECCYPHSSDYWPTDNSPGPGNRWPDWTIDFHELLRFIQLYNVGSYHEDPTTEDGFAPGEAGLGGPVALEAAPPASQAAPPVAGTRHVSGNEYTAGEFLEVEVRVEHDGTPLALGARETLPAGWSFVSASGLDVPLFRPLSGATGIIEFGWLYPPSSPVEFSYTVFVPTWEATEAVLRGEVVYRTDGAEQSEAIPDTVLRPAGRRLIATIQLEGYTGSPGAVLPFRFAFTDAAGALLGRRDVTIYFGHGRDTEVVVLEGVPQGAVWLSCKELGHFLRRRVSIVGVGAELTAEFTGGSKLLGGDVMAPYPPPAADTFNFVDIADLWRVLLDFGRIDRPGSDINGDGVVDIQEFGCISIHLFEAGDPE